MKHHPDHSAHLLVSQHRVGLQRRHVAGKEGRSRPVVLTEDGAIDIVEAVAWHQPVSTGGTAETLEVVDIALCFHDHLVGWDGLATGTAGPAVPKQSDIVTPTKDHAPFAVAGGADVTQLCVAARTLEAACVPVAVHGEK